MGNEPRAMWAFCLAILMILPVGIFTTGSVVCGPDIQEEYYVVKTFDDGLMDSLHKSTIDITEDYGHFTLSKMTDMQADILDNAGYEVEKVDTSILFPTVAFDTNNGEPALSEELTAMSDYYVVQFIGPIVQDWKAQLEELGALNTDQYWSNHAYIMKMDEATKLKVEALPFINWIGQYQPAYKMATVLSEFKEYDTVTVSVFKNENFYNVVARLRSLGAKIKHINPKENWDSQVRIEVDTSLIPEIVSIEEVSSIAQYVMPRVMNDQAATKYCTASNLAWYKETSGIDLPNPSSTKYVDYPSIVNTWGGLTGFDQVVGITDTGFDTGSDSSGHYDMFLGPLGDRFVGIHRSGACSPNMDDHLHAHGTHVVGIVAGNGYCAETHYGMDTNDHVYGGDHVFAGMAPEALISFNAAGDNTQDGGMCPITPNCWNTEHSDGAYIHTNSWGGGSGYTGTTAQDADQFMWDNQGDLIFCCAGGSGPASSTISPPASAKNDMTVGASGNYRPAYKFQSDPNLIVPFSSRGPFPVTNGRYEPDIVAPGHYVVSLTATDYKYDLSDADGDGDEYNDPYRPEDCYAPGVYQTGLVQHDYVPMSGTSMASAAAAGVCALIRQYYTQMEGITPSGRLMKAAGVHGGIDMDFGFPSNDQGWGRMNVKETLFPNAPATVQYFDHKTGINSAVTWNAASDGGLNTNLETDRVPLKVTLVTLDTAGNNGRLSNDLDLVLTSPSATIYRGNNFAGAWSISGGADDDDMLVERVLIEQPETGTWTIQVNGENTPDGNTPFAIIVSGDFGPERDYKVEMTTEFNTIFKCVPGGSTTFRYNLLNFGTQDDTIALSENNLPAGFTVTYTPTSPIDLLSNDDTDVTVLIEVIIAVAPEAYDFEFIGTSQNDPATPPTQDKIEVVCGIQEFALPEKIRCTNSMASEGSPTIATHNDGTDDYLFITYLKYDENGPHVYLRFSTDYGDTWTERQVSTQNDAPEDPRIVVYPQNSPITPNRVLIIWHGSDPGAGSYNSYVYCSYADPPYGSWTEVQVVATDTGSQDPSTSHRRVSATIYRPGIAGQEEVIVTIECLGSSNDIDIWDVYTENGGATWLGWGSTAPAASANLDFFQEVATDQNGDVYMVNYRSPGAQKRDIYFTTYNGNGTWSAQSLIPQLNTADNDVFPTIWSSDEGASNNRLYVACLHTTLDPPDPPFRIYVSHSDDGGTSWSPASGPYGTSASQSGYSSGRPLIMGVYTPTDGCNWLTREEEPTGAAGENPYPIPNIHSQYTVNGFTSDYLFKVTADSVGKEHPTFAALGDTIYHVFAAQYEPGNKDIWMVRYNKDWTPPPPPDTEGPTVMITWITPDPPFYPNPALLTAVIDDTFTGYSAIQAAEYDLGPTPYPTPSWPGTSMIASDGSFNSPIEAVEATIDTMSLTPCTWYTVWIRGQDSEGNWGEAESFTFYVDFIPMMPWVHVVTPNGGEAWMGGSSQDISWEMGDIGYPMSTLTADIYYSTTGPGGPWIPINTVVGITTYNWNPIPMVDSTNCYVRIEVTNPSMLFDSDTSNSSFTIDSTAPAPATNVRAELTAPNHVTVYWDGSVSTDVDHYEIFYKLNDWDPTGDSYSFLVDKGLATIHQHNNVGVNNPSSYCWQIRTYDAAGHETRSTVQAGKTGSTQSTFANPSGWFMLGSHLVQSDTSLAHVIQGAGLPTNWNYAQVYDAVNGDWDSYLKGRPDSKNDLTDITNEQGFWLHITSSTRFATAGYITDVNIPLKAGWNCVPYPYADRQKTASQIELDLMFNCPGFESWEIFDFTAAYRLKTPSGAENLMHGSSFWIKVTADCTWTVINYY